MSRMLKITLIAFGIVTILFGIPLLGAPGRFLGMFGWAPVDPLISRILGSGLLALAWASFRGMSTGSREGAKPVIEAGAVFCSLAVIGLVRNMLGTSWPLMVWIVLGLFVIFSVLWILQWVKK